jgi:hypothetical protein
MDRESEHPRLPKPAVVLLVLGVVLAVLAIVLVATAGPLGLLLIGPSLVLLGIGVAIARKPAHNV